jgi:hypothetical protein
MMGAALASLALAGCDGGGETQTKTKTVTASNPFVEQLKGLDEMNRGLALRRAVQDSNQPCKRVVSSGYQQDYKNMSVWNLRCTDGEYALFIAPNGDVQVRSCADVKALNVLECRFQDAGGEAEGAKKKS